MGKQKASMKRRSFLKGMPAAAAAGFAGPLGTAAPALSSSALPPRKVIVGTVVQGFWVEHPGLKTRLKELETILDEMRAASMSRYGRGVDLAVLPEAAITGETGDDTPSRAALWEGPVGECFARKARELGAYVVVPTYLREPARGDTCSNAAVLIDRQGAPAGVYRKVHLVVSSDGKTMEGGATPGDELPVFDCDFGKLAIQICYDMEFDRGWDELKRKGAELVVWPTQSPQTAHPAARAMALRAWIVSSTWRHNASVFEPTGKIAAQVRPPERILVHELDLSYAILPWSSKLRRGKALEERFGARTGYRYYEEEDCGIFWSNDPETPVRAMIEALGLVEAEEELERVREAYRRARVLDY